MDKFAKLFEFDDIGQVLVTLEGGDEGPEVRVKFKPKNLGVCSIKLSFTNDDEDKAWTDAETTLENMDEAKAYELASSIMNEGALKSLCESQKH